MYNHLLKLYIFFLHVVPLFCLLKEIRPSAAVRPSGRTAADPPALPFHSEKSGSASGQLPTRLGYYKSGIFATPKLLYFPDFIAFFLTLFYNRIIILQKGRGCIYAQYHRRQ